MISSFFSGTLVSNCAEKNWEGEQQNTSTRLFTQECPLYPYRDHEFCLSYIFRNVSCKINQKILARKLFWSPLLALYSSVKSKLVTMWSLFLGSPYSRDGTKTKRKPYHPSFSRKPIFDSSRFHFHILLSYPAVLCHFSTASNYPHEILCAHTKFRR